MVGGAGWSMAIARQIARRNDPADVALGGRVALNKFALCRNIGNDT